MSFYFDFFRSRLTGIWSGFILYMLCYFIKEKQIAWWGIFLLIAFLLNIPSVKAQASTSTNFTVLNPVITVGAQNSSSTNFGLGQSVWQTAIGRSTSTSFQVLSGFQYFFSASPNNLSVTVGNSQVSLSWSAPQIFWGASVASYEVGIGTVPGIYTFENVGSVTSFVKSGLNNGTVYYFKVRAKTAGGIVLATSNEVSAIPVQSSVNPPGSGGGGGGYDSGTFRVLGLAAPNSKVVILHNGFESVSGKTNSKGEFDLLINNVSPGSYNYALYYLDPEGAKSDFLNLRVTVLANFSAISEGVLLPPTIRADKVEVKHGDVVRFYGYAIPNSSVMLQVKDGDFVSASISADGKYSIDSETKNVNIGESYARTKVVFENLQSPFSTTIKFLIGTENILSPEIGACPAKADFNNDCRVSLIDFSILAYWFRSSEFPSEIDLNQDKRVDLIDFSILAYYWTD